VQVEVQLVSLHKTRASPYISHPYQPKSCDDSWVSVCLAVCDPTSIRSTLHLGDILGFGLLAVEWGNIEMGL
jgi:hypothetical protein